MIHTAFIHDFSDDAASVEVDPRATAALGEALAGSGRPLVVTAGVLVASGGGAATEDTPADPGFSRQSEAAALPFAAREVRVAVVRLPPRTGLARRARADRPKGR